MDPTTGGDRSPISPYALTLDELKALGPGARIVFFNASKGSSEVRRVIDLDDNKIYSRPEIDREGPDGQHMRYFSDSGLVALANGSWNKLNITVRAEDVDKLPEPDPQLASKLDDLKRDR